MPFANLAPTTVSGKPDRVRLHFQLEGREDAPVLVLSNSLGTNLDMWAPQMPALLEQFRVLCYDGRGHGQSEVTPGPYSIAQLSGDVVALMDHLNIARAHFCGLSMGGMIGMWLGTHRPKRVERLVLCNTAAKIGTPDMWNARIANVEREGMAAIVPGVIDRWFTKDFQNYAQLQVGLVRDMLLSTSTLGYAANCAAVRDMDQRNEIAAIVAPTMVIVGKHDLVSTPDDARILAAKIHGAQLVELNAAHLSNWEMAQGFTAHLIDFLGKQDRNHHG
jgi:3-oxoadipate enol-lactonase